MKYRVVVTDRAGKELHNAADYLAQRAPQAANRWYTGIIRTIRELAVNPERHSLARESPKFSYDLREVLYGRRRNYRVIYTIRDSDVVVIAIRHTAQQELNPDEF